MHARICVQECVCLHNGGEAAHAYSSYLKKPDVKSLNYESAQMLGHVLTPHYPHSHMLEA